MKKRTFIVIGILLLIIGFCIYILSKNNSEKMEYKGNKYVYLEPSKGTFIYSFLSKQEFEVDKIYDVSNDRWNFIYSEGDLYVLDKQYKDAIKYYDNDDNYKYTFVLDDVGEYSIKVSDKELKYLYDIDNKKRNISLSFDEIESMGSIVRTSKDGVFIGTISLAQYQGKWYYRTEVMNDKDEEYMIKLPDSLNNKINSVIGK